MGLQDFMKRLDKNPALKEDYLWINRTVMQDFGGGPVQRPLLVERTLEKGGSSRENIEEIIDEMIDLDLLDLKEMTY